MPFLISLLAMILSTTLRAQQPTTMMGMTVHGMESEMKQGDESVVTFLRARSDSLGECPKTLDAWKTWRREKFVTLINSQGLKLLKEGENNEATLNDGSISGFLKRCRPGQELIHDQPEFKACFGRILEIERISGLFLEATFAQEAEEVSAVSGFPASYTAENLRAIPKNLDPGETDKLKETLKTLTAGAKDVKVVRFDSAIIKGLESLVILDIRPDGQQFWTHFTLPGKPDDFLSIAVTPKNPPHGTSTFQLHSLNGGQGRLRKKNVDPITCVQCHRTSPISLVSKDPKGIKVLLPEGEEDALKALSEMNQHIANVSLALPKDVNLEALGPARGPNQKRPLEYLRRLAKKTSTPAVDDAALKRVAPHMNCVKCHDSKTRARNIADQFFLPDLFENYVLSGHMPPKAGLSAEDRKLLSELISAEYLGGYPTADKNGKEPGILAKWLNETCPWTK